MESQAASNFDSQGLPLPRDPRVLAVSPEELIPEVLENEKYHHVLLSPDLVCNEAAPTRLPGAFGALRRFSWPFQDFLRMIVSNLPQDRQSGLISRMAPEWAQL